jgi:LmbE family N-acetylglucosaminyl deacetylase
MSANSLLTRKDFVIALTGGVLLPHLVDAQPRKGKLLIVVAHPDDEYTFAAATYRLVRECGWTADQVTITDGESGYRYASLAEEYHGVSLAPSKEGRSNLAEIRKKETINAGKILGIRHHYFLEQRDLGFNTEAKSASSANWDYPYLNHFLSSLLDREQYDIVFTLLPTPETHGNHRAATLVALEAVSKLSGRRPMVLGAEPRGQNEPIREFGGLTSDPLTLAVAATPTLVFDRNTVVRVSRMVELSGRSQLADRRAQNARALSKRLSSAPVRRVLGLCHYWEDAAQTVSDLRTSFQPIGLQTVAQKGSSK